MKKMVTALVMAGLLAVSGMVVQAETEWRSITVSGVGVMMAPTDRAVIRIAVETSAIDAKKAARDNANKMTAVKKALLMAGVQEENVETDHYNLYPTMGYDNNGKVKTKRYEARNSLRVTVDALESTGRVMDVAIAAGANRIDAVEFTVSDEKPFEEQSLRLAVSDAKRKAEVIAASLGRRVVNVISVNENSMRAVPYRISLMKSGEDMEYNTETPVNAGDAELESCVTVVFEIV